MRPGGKEEFEGGIYAEPPLIEHKLRADHVLCVCVCVCVCVVLSVIDNGKITVCHVF